LAAGSRLAVGYGKWRAFSIGSLTGLAIPIILGIAAGAMLFIISK
jgi:zinc transporter ZupT